MTRVLALAAFTAFLPISNALAHCFVGGRFMPATLTVDDPCVADELRFLLSRASRMATTQRHGNSDISGEYSKRITDTLGVSIGSTWTHLQPPGGPNASGFQNLETTLKWQFLTLPQQELVMSVGISAEWGGSGAQGVGAERFTTYTPTFWFGKGFGTFRTARDGCEHLPLPAKSDTRFRATAPHRSSASIPIPATKSSTRNFTRACLTGVARSSTACPT